ncbi:hypothetical protein DPMN_052296 [Dreissena polymorpha]|uniref:Uncharacterized protein n=1 Tax=Dreissena polymorpha TaxID=45954 RepID=A0A9D4HP72_DREPO|nr:hypothetical protein DPMN_052296 [Dreissena polymorpha]
MDTVEPVSWEEPVLGVYRGDNENAPQVGSEPTNSRSLGGHLIRYITSTSNNVCFSGIFQHLEIKDNEVTVA